MRLDRGVEAHVIQILVFTRMVDLRLMDGFQHLRRNTECLGFPSATFHLCNRRGNFVIVTEHDYGRTATAQMCLDLFYIGIGQAERTGGDLPSHTTDRTSGHRTCQQ